MVKKIIINKHVNSIAMPDNLKIGLMIAEHRIKCSVKGCNFDYFNFAFGQSPFHVPPPIVKSLSKNADKGHYSDAEGIPALREAIVKFNKKYFGIKADPSRVVIGHGTKGMMYTIFNIIEGHIIIPSPSWIGYAPQAHLLGKKIHTMHLKKENSYKIDLKDLNLVFKKLGRGKKQHILVLNNPHNPSGAVYTKKELIGIANLCRRNNVLVLSDEIYALMTYNFKKFVSMGRIYPKGTFVTNGISKDRSSAGYRLGYCILPSTCCDEIKKDFKKVAATVYTNVSTPIQYAAIDGFNPNSEIEEYFKITRSIHRIIGICMSEAVGKIKGLCTTCPEGGFYFLIDFNKYKKELKKKGVINSNSLAKSMISHPHHIGLVTGDACMLRSNDFSARIAFVDYDGKRAFMGFKKNPPRSKKEELDFVKKYAPKIISGVAAISQYVNWLKE
ncbi:pyridoxal phosphate-dependent aminotransferase [Candidatus Woesearchaeota archaeon]|jgi:aspartate aminotransferase|nr:pyridoxal phosphate-dependent aminotransferase [Candidatus Woesearchaeota archaeon]MBT6518797.1 pyridoxal phosphate-dependent aminotransferase [Candidatus Woesearchaeota archaeon]MBT7367936.1 pyridoxal phosphate-dependent aminotransferase [Candidatus Woesearchaeota archaeon]